VLLVVGDAGSSGCGRPPDHARVRLEDRHRRRTDAAPAHRRAELRDRVARTVRVKVEVAAAQGVGVRWRSTMGGRTTKPVGGHDLAMNDEGRLTLGNGRTLAWREYGPPDGRPLLRFKGMPGSRYSRHPHEESYDRFGVRVIVSDRPGFGASTRLGGRGISVVADDAASLLDHLGLDVVYVSGTSGRGPHALAFAALCPERVRAATVVVGAAPVLEEDTAGLIGLNREDWHASREGCVIPPRRSACRRRRGVRRERGGRCVARTRRRRPSERSMPASHS